MQGNNAVKMAGMTGTTQISSGFTLGSNTYTSMTFSNGSLVSVSGGLGSNTGVAPGNVTIDANNSNYAYGSSNTGANLEFNIAYSPPVPIGSFGGVVGYYSANNNNKLYDLGYVPWPAANGETVATFYAPVPTFDNNNTPIPYTVYVSSYGASPKNPNPLIPLPSNNATPNISFTVTPPSVIPWENATLPVNNFHAIPGANFNGVTFTNAANFSFLFHFDPPPKNANYFAFQKPYAGAKLYYVDASPSSNNNNYVPFGLFPLTGQSNNNNYTSAPITLPIVASSPSANYSYNLYMVSYTADGTENAIVPGQTPEVDISFTWPPISQTYAPNASNFNLTSQSYTTNYTGQKVLVLDFNWTLPPGTSTLNYGSGQIFVDTTGTNNATNAKLLVANTIGNTAEVQVSYYPQSANQNWSFFFVSSNPYSQGNPISSSPSITRLINVPSNGPTGIEKTLNVSNASVTTTTLPASDGTTTQFITATFTRPNISTWGGVELQLYTLPYTNNNAVLVGKQSGALTILYNVPSPANNTNWYWYLVSYDVNNQYNTIFAA